MNKRAPAKATVWTNASVLGFAGESDPVDAMQLEARKKVLEAQEQGWKGPPFDPFELAALLRLRVTPRDDVPDARTVPHSDGSMEIEYNPSRPPARVRFSLAHEIAHTLFPDCADTVRNRHKVEIAASDDWQLETLCNIGAAELLMPIGSLPNSAETEVGIDKVLELRARFEVSTESVLLRLVRITGTPCAVFAASRIEEGRHAGRYRFDYVRLGGGLQANVAAGELLSPSTVVAQCTAIGFTAKGSESWPGIGSIVRVEAVGIPPFPGRVFPRVVGVMLTNNSTEVGPSKIEYLVGDATSPRGPGRRVIAQVVNDGTPRWGAGFALAVAKKFPEVQRAFIEWSKADRAHLKLGNTHVTSTEDGAIDVFHMVAQHGYGASKKPRIRYEALEKGLAQLRDYAQREDATVHMPRVGSGEARGSWGVVEEMISEQIVRKGVRVFVYDLPNRKAPPKAAHSLFEAS